MWKFSWQKTEETLKSCELVFLVQSWESRKTEEAGKQRRFEVDVWVLLWRRKWRATFTLLSLISDFPIERKYFFLFFQLKNAQFVNSYMTYGISYTQQKLQNHLTIISCRVWCITCLGWYMMYIFEFPLYKLCLSLNGKFQLVMKNICSVTWYSVLSKGGVDYWRDWDCLGKQEKHMQFSSGCSQRINRRFVLENKREKDIYYFLDINARA